MSKGEFFIEAFGKKRGTKSPIGDLVPFPLAPLAYGHLDPWYSSNWNYKREITINASQIATTTDSFPVLATTTLADLKTIANGGKVINDNGYDIFFTDDDGTTVLDFEREKYASTTGEIVYWIKTDISSTTDKTIYMYYGNGSATDLATTTGVWDDNFVMVQHLQETDIDAGSGDIKDSTSNGNNGTTSGMDSADQVAGQVDGSFDFDGSDDYVVVSDDDSLDMSVNDEVTIEGWIKPVGSGDAQQNIIDQEVSMRMQYEPGGKKIEYSTVDGTEVQRRCWSSDNSINDNEWYYVAYAVKNDELIGYLDGESVCDISFSNGLYNKQAGLKIGRYQGSATEYFNGTIDEVRISNIARSAGWIETEYNNQSDTDSFMTIFGVEEGILTISTNPKVIIAGTESTAFTVQIDHNVAADTTINLSSDSSGTYYFAATPGGAEVSSVTIPSGTNSVDFYYTDYEVGSPTIVVAATNFVSDDQQQTVQRLKYQFSPGGSFEMQGKIKFE